MKKVKSHKLPFGKFAMLCYAVYQSVFNQKKHGFDKQKMIHNFYGGAFLRILWNADEIIVLFRGSRFWEDFIVDFQFLPKKENYVSEIRKSDFLVHTGFDNLLDTPSSPPHDERPPFDQLMEHLEPLLQENNGRKLYFTGHSLGGALAVLAANRVDAKYPDRIEAVYTFGQPAVGGRGFYDNYRLHDRTYRYCSGVDIVTFFPPFFYKHVGQQFWIHDEEIYSNVHWLRRLWESFLMVFKSFVSNHAIKKYVRLHDLFD
jgi:predicted lipase